MAKLYVVLVVLMAIVFALFGVILPMLFSAKSTEAVLVGGLIVVILPLVAYGVFNILKGKTNE